MAKTKKAIFSIQDEPPEWPDDDEGDLDLESASSDQDVDEVESPVGIEGEDELDDNEIEIKPRTAKSEQVKADTEDDNDDEKEDEKDDEDDGLNVVTPIQPSTKFAPSRHDTIIGRARPEMVAVAAAAAAASKNSNNNRDDSRENDGDSGEDDDWVDPTIPSPPLATPTPPMDTKEHKETSSAHRDTSSEGSHSGPRVPSRDDDASVTPRPASATQHAPPPSTATGQQQPKPRSTKDLPSIPTTVVSMSREPSSRPSSSSRRLSQVPISDGPVPFPTSSSDHRKHSSSSSRSATSSSNPTSPLSSPASQQLGHSASNSTSTPHSNAHAHHLQQSSIDRDTTGYPFPGSVSDESESSSDSGPSSDAWGGDEKQGLRGGLVPKRERRTTVGRTVAHSPMPAPVSKLTPSAAASGNGNVHTQQQSIGRMSSIGKAKHGGRTTGSVRAVWKDEDGDDF